MINLNNILVDRRTVISNIVSSIDFSKKSYASRSDINYNEINISEIPCADVAKIDEAFSFVSQSINAVLDQTQKSRLGSKNKESATKLCERIISLSSNMDTYNNSRDIVGDKWSSLETSVGYLNQLIKLVPSSSKNLILKALSVFHDVSVEYSHIMTKREHILWELEEVILDNSEKYQREEWKHKLADKPLTIDLVHAVENYLYIDALCSIAFDRYGKGGASFMRCVCTTKKESMIKMDFVSASNVKGVVDCARTLGINTFAFVNHSTAALECLCQFSALGASIRFETLDTIDCWGDTQKEHLAIVTLNG